MNERKNAYPTVGFIGAGAITQAVVTGFCERAADAPFPIVLSPRSRETAARLRAAYPARVSVAQSMQEVLDRAEWVVLAVPPAVGEEVCRSLRFRADHKVISFLPDKTLPQLREWIGETAALVHMVPLTFNAICDGPILLYPPHSEAAALFARIGRVVEVDSPAKMSALSTITACVTPFFAVMDTLISWLGTQSVSAAQATDYVTGFFSAMCSEAVSLAPEAVHRMARESTPGGINLMAKDIIQKAGGFAVWDRTMERVFARVAEAPEDG